jgi:RNA polymerase sigma factor (sigma-70 family)
LDAGQRTGRFEEQVLTHLSSAYNLARWITHSDSVARDAVQDACLHAFRGFDQMHGPNARAWFLAIVRNSCFDQLRKLQQRAVEDEYDDELHGGEAPAACSRAMTPEDIAASSSDARWLRACIDGLPSEYREIIMLRELEEMSYKEIGAIVDVPIGTVMSRLSRARDLLQQRMLSSRKRSRS